MIRSLGELTEKAKGIGQKKIVLVGSEDREGILALKEAAEKRIAVPILVGKKAETQKILDELDFSAEVIEAETAEEASEIGVRLIRQGAASILMKGMVKTSHLLKAVLNKEWGLRKGKVLSHIAALDVPALDRLIFVSDGGMIIKPYLETKKEIINNSVTFLNKLGYELPKVAVIAAVEVVNPDMPETLDASILAKMSDRHQIKSCTVDGPLGLDNALNVLAAKIKGVSGEVAGMADILIVPDIHSGNFLGKSAIYLAGGTIAGLILGAAAPVIIVSRADSSDSKLASIAMAVCSAD